MKNKKKMNLVYVFKHLLDNYVQKCFVLSQAQKILLAFHFHTKIVLTPTSQINCDYQKIITNSKFVRPFLLTKTKKHFDFVKKYKKI